MDPIPWGCVEISVAIALSAAASACAAPSGQGFADDERAAASDSGAGEGTGLSPGGALEAGAPSFGDGGAGGAPSGCGEAAQRVYLVSAQKELHSFWPPTLEIKRIGALACDPSSTPFSMAVDRSGTAWVLYKNGKLFRVNTSDASCAPTTYAGTQPGLDQFGMGFSTNGKSQDETLYISTTIGFGTLDVKSLTARVLGPFKGGNNGGFAELTGTGDGRLYGFFLGDPASLNEIDKTSANVGARAPIGTLSTGTAFAFSFWGGDFYFYTADSRNAAKPHSDVTRYRPSDGSVTVVKPQVGFRIVGAGVSTCAPVLPPK